ncbi:MAG: xanthine dehydrogenase family protein subunit M [Acidobacteria bacterium]|nr:xanthine dehydrogenase family protein subunit M [Acidobacteriota bacterium]
MFPAKFDYVRADSAADVGRLLAEHDDAKLLAGGHSLIPILKLRLAAPATLIDIGRIPELKGVSVEGGALRIGALTTHAELASSDDIRRQAPALAEAAAQIGDPAVRNRGTIGGNVAHADPASDLPAVLTALGATFHMTGPDGSRAVPAESFFEGMMMTALQDNELLTAVEVPCQAEGQASAYSKLPHPASRYAVIGAAVRLTVAEGRCTEARVVLGGLTPIPTRALAVEQALTGKPLDDRTLQAASAATADGLGDDLLGDIYASAEYRKAVAHVYVRRALAAAAGRLA